MRDAAQKPADTCTNSSAFAAVTPAVVSDHRPGDAPENSARKRFR